MTLSVTPKPSEMNNSLLFGGTRDECDKVVEVKESPDISKESYRTHIIWRYAFGFLVFHTCALYGLYLAFTSAMWETNVFAFLLYIVSGLGVTAGAHRLWAHRSYKARLPLRILLVMFYSMAFQLNIVHWVRDHRVHHMYSETHADPHDATRGFFFSHIGWIMCKRHPECLKKLKTADISDLMADPLIRFQKRYYTLMVLLCCFALPIITAMYLWGESVQNTFFIACVFRHVFVLHMTFLVNSAAHLWGSKPYDVNINPSENAFVVFGAIGEGFHNYHHTFPFDYSTSEYGFKYNLTTAFIDMMACVGLAYDCKTASRSVIEARKLRTGEESCRKIK